MVEYGVLGPISARVDGRPVDLGGIRTRAVLALLLLNRNAVVSVDRLVDLVWGDEPPATAETALQGHVSRLRRLLGAPAIETRPPGYLLRVEPGAIDVERFESLVQRARAATPGEAGKLLREALDLWGGAALADLAHLSFAIVEIARLEELHLGALEARIEADLASGQYEALAGELDALVAKYPYRERLHGQRMLALYRSGRQAEALAAYQAARAALDEGLGIDPSPELQALEVRILQQDPTLAAPTAEIGAATLLHVPMVEALIGRESELSAVEAALVMSRLVTITGLGGVGKTRLAIAAAEGLASKALPARFVDLSLVSDAADVLGAIAAALGVSDSPDVELEILTAKALARHPCLLVLDNFEHVLKARTLVTRILEQAEEVRLIATSRVRLGLPAEREIPLGPLPLPESAASLESSAAGHLFLRRARQRGGLQGLETRDADAVVQICRRLDGLPLALELAASWTRVLSPRAIVHRLDEGRLELAGEEDTRHSSLERVVASTLELVGPLDGAAFETMGLFVGGFDEADASAVTGLGDPLPTLRRLESVALIRAKAESDGEPWFGLLETIRSVASHRFTLREDADDVRHRFVSFYAAGAQVTADALRDFDSGGALAWMTREYGNLRTAFDMASALREVPLAVQLASTMATFEVHSGGIRTSLRRLRAALALGPVSPALRSQALSAVVNLSVQVDESIDLLALSQEALDLARQAGDRRLEVRAMIAVGSIGRPPNAEALLAEAAAAASEIGYGWAAAVATANRAELSWSAGRIDEALELYRQTSLLGLRGGDDSVVGPALANMAEIHANLGQGEIALELATRAITKVEITWPGSSTLAWALAVKAVAEALAGDPANAYADLAEACRVAVASESEATIGEVLEKAVTVLVAEHPIVAAQARGCYDRIVAQAGIQRSVQPLVTRSTEMSRRSIEVRRFDRERWAGADLEASSCVERVRQAAADAALAVRNRR